MPTPLENSIGNLRDLLDVELNRELTRPPQVNKATVGDLPIIETKVPFQKSILWQWQREFFEETGPEAWRGGIVPHYITSNSYIAHAYAELVLGYQQDRAAANDHQPLTLLELGGGSGQFTFHFLRHYTHIAPPGLPPIEYLFTDVAEANLTFAAQHPKLQDFAESGVLDFARFDIMNPKPLQLVRAGGERLQETQSHPILVIANYLWDSIPTELWRIGSEKSNPLSVTVSLPTGNKPPYTFQDLPNVSLQFHEEESPPSLPPLVEYYQQQAVTGEVLVPMAGLRCLSWLAAKCNDKLWLLSSDKAEHSPFSSIGRFGLAHHGSFSFPVNFHAFAYWSQQRGGPTCTNQDIHPSLFVGLFGSSGCSLGTHLRQAVNQHICQFTPGDQFILKRLMERQYEHFSKEEVIAYLRFSQFDPKALRRGLPTLMGLVNSFSRGYQQEILRIIQHCWDNYYPLGEQPDLAFQVGSLLYEMDEFALAKHFFEQSVLLYGPDEGTLANIKSCDQMLGLP